MVVVMMVPTESHPSLNLHLGSGTVAVASWSHQQVAVAVAVAAAASAKGQERGPAAEEERTQLMGATLVRLR